MAVPVVVSCLDGYPERMTGIPMASWADQQKAELEARFPGWKIWYVPRSAGSTTWCAQPEPLLNCGTPQELEEEITAAMTEDVWPEERPASIRPVPDEGG